MPRQEKLAFTRRPAKILGGARHRPLRKSDLLPPRFKQRIGEKAKLEEDVHALNRPGTAEPHPPTPPPALFPEEDSSEEEPEPEDLLKRTKLRYKKAKKSRKEAQKEYKRVKDPEDDSLETRIAYAVLEDATAWESRYKRDTKTPSAGRTRPTTWARSARRRKSDSVGRCGDEAGVGRSRGLRRCLGRLVRRRMGGL